MTGLDIEWEERTDIKIRLNPDLVKIYPLGHDADVFVDAGGKRYRALVPTSTLGEGHEYVPAQRVGRSSGNRVIVALPASNEGANTWHIPESDLEGMLYQ